MQMDEVMLFGNGSEEIESENEIGDGMELEVEDNFEIESEDEIGLIGDGMDNPENGIVIPIVGMQFHNDVEAHKCYKEYASKKGFEIRKETSTTSKKHGISSVRYSCTKQGFSKRQKHEQMVQQQVPQELTDIQRTPKKERSSTRCGCKAYLRVRRMPCGNWQVSAFDDEHNHGLVTSPSKKRKPKGELSFEQKEIIAKMRAQNVSISQIWNYLGDLAGGVRYLTITKRDVVNEVSKVNSKLVGVDVETTLIYFRKKQEDDPDFFYDIEPDDDGAVKNLFWVDGRGRRAYKEFGDVVTFDTTYSTNKYCMPLGPFAGVDHHWVTIFFGCCLLRNEQASNFVWLFKTWLRAMNNKAPKAIITDQDPAMKSAIGEVFGPNTIHRCCQWHVMRKAREHLWKLYDKKEGFEKEFKAIINRSVTILEFEQSWNKMIEKYHLEGVKHLNTMYEKRDEWVPCYFRHTFFANMTTTQRSESANFVLKLWVDNHTSIYKFVMQFEKMVDAIWQKESLEDCKTSNETPQLWSLSRIEVDARDAYTRTLFSKFKKNLKGGSNAVVVEIEKNVLFEVSITYNPIVPNWIPETHRVEVDLTSRSFSCSCKGFEFQGLLCAHALRVMQHVGVQRLPLHYILKRWTKDANMSSKRLAANVSNGSEENEAEKCRYAAIYPKMIEVGKLVSKSEPLCRLFEITLDEWKEKALIVEPVVQVVPRVELPTKSTSKYHDPPMSQTKGRRKPGRLKPPSETNVKKQRTCGFCNEKKGHNWRTCPKRLQSGGSVMEDEEDASDMEDEEDASD